ncbi:uncharacterized protein LOC134231846 [Saccostrea cucullata]|uniref:uncharacterized protein LOC134231846 n=1 Tax=Saccostrea cuccullata TaxID=36930 RepID=UPI002ED05D31
MFAVVHFVDDESVECVPKSWLEGQYCYWPNSNAKRKIKKMSLPDKESWKKFKFRKIGQDYEDYETARKNLKKAEETSNLESEEDSRKRKLPARLISESESGTDIESDEEGKRKPSPKKSRVPQREDHKKHRTPVKKASVISPPPSLPVRKHTLITASVRRQLLDASIRKSPRSKPGVPSFIPEKSPRRDTIISQVSSVVGAKPSSSRSSSSISQPKPGMCSSDVGTSSTKNVGGNISELLHQVISKIDILQQDIAAIKTHLISSVDVDIDTIESLLPSGSKLDSVPEVEDFQESLDENSKRKLINAMAALQGGDNAGEICRAIMRSIMTNKCMSQFSGTGQKGKTAFIGTPLFKIILSAARKASKKTIAFDAIKREVLDVLRFAPYLPGGSNYAKKKGKKSKSPRLDEFPSDSE